MLKGRNGGAGRDCQGSKQQETLGDRPGENLRGSWIVWWMGQAPTAPSGRRWQGSQSSEGATELGFPGPALGKMQGEVARRVGEASGHREEPPPQGLGGYDLLAQTEPRGPAGQVMRQHLHRQPGGVGGEATRGEMIQPHAVLEVSDGVLDLGVAAVVGLQCQGIAVPVGDATVIAVVGVDSGRGQNRTLSPLSARMPSCAAMKRRTLKDVQGNGLSRHQNPPLISKGVKLEREAQPVVSPRRTRICSMSSSDSV